MNLKQYLLQKLAKCNINYETVIINNNYNNNIHGIPQGKNCIRTQRKSENNNKKLKQYKTQSEKK